MAGTLIAPSVHWVDDGSVAAPNVAPLQLFETDTPHHYVFARRGRRVAGSVVASSRGYVVTVGDQSGLGIVVDLGGAVIIF